MKSKYSFYIILPFLVLFPLSILSGCSGSGGGGGGGGGGSNSVTISGQALYEDKEYGPGGFTGATSFKAVRYAVVEIVDAVSYEVVSTGTTDGSGNYSITYIQGASSTVYVRVMSLTGGSAPPVEVHNLYNALYGVASQNMASSSAVVNISIPVTNNAAGAFNILDVYASAGEFIKSLAGANPSTAYAYWQTGNLNGTYYCSSPDPIYCTLGEGIYVLSETGGDTDEYDDDVLWHEYGHFTAAHYSKDDSPGGYHSLSDNNLDLRLSWSEGWGDFFPGAVKTWLHDTQPSLLSAASSMPLPEYIDTLRNSFGVKFDFGAAAGPPYVYSSNESAVANILWNVMNGTSNRMAGVWDVFHNYMQTAASPINLESFWDGWIARGQPGVLTPYFNNKSIYYQLDTFELDNSPSSTRKIAIGTTGETHYLYNSSDVDFAAFDAVSGTSYTIGTYNLVNGADTYLTLLGTDGSTPLSTNDNWDSSIYTNCDATGSCPANDMSALSSRISWTAPSTGTYYIKVNSSSIRPPSAGRYGTYTLKITSP